MNALRTVWDAHERLFAYVLRLRSLGPESMLRVKLMTYRGRVLRAGEEVLLPGTRVLELHLDNRRVGGLASTGTEAVFRLRERLRGELPLLQRAVREDRSPVAGVVATSLLAFGLRSLGFHVEALPPRRGRRFLSRRPPDD